jgi:hypothetical protein
MSPVIEDMACQRESLGPACGVTSAPSGPCYVLPHHEQCFKVRSGHGDPEAAHEAWFLEIGPLELDACSWPLVLTPNDAHIALRGR